MLTFVCDQISHDDPMSIVHDYGREQHDPTPVQLVIGSLSTEHLSNLSFLFGGVGDGNPFSTTLRS